MTRYLLLVTVGPVQDFIAQARRTRDFWYGSHLLSELSRKAAMAIVAQGGQLIFPALDQSIQSELDELSVCLSPSRKSGKPPLNIANKILAELPAAKAPKDVAKEVRKSVYEFWVATAGRVRKDCNGLLAAGIKSAWDEQIDTLLEFAAAWAPFDEPNASYKKAREQVEKAITARKNLRDFEPWTKQRGNVPKSSLDGARETVLKNPKIEPRDTKLARKYRIADTEQLDAVGLVKRAGGEPEQFVPVVNVALASWTAFVAKNRRDMVERLRNACKDREVARVNRTDLPFGFDASVLLPRRWRPTFEEQGLGTPQEADKWGKDYVRPLLAEMSEPYAYVACLVADGDGMGAAIETMQSALDHRTFSRALAGFAGKARAIVEQQHLGSLVYSGGDDVLAFLPLPEALACAKSLAVEFAGDLPKEQQRNALAILLDKRSGGTRQWRAQWSECERDPVGRLLLDATAFDDEMLSRRKVYEIDRTLKRLPEKVSATEDSHWARLLRLEVLRSLARMEAGYDAGDGSGVGATAQKLGLLLDEDAKYSAVRKLVSSWVDRVLIAAMIAQAEPRLLSRAKEVSA